MKRFLKNIISLAALLFLVQNAFAQTIDLSLAEVKTCATYTYCVTVGMESTAGSGTQNIGNSSLLLTYDSEAISYQSYTSQHFDGSDLCVGGSSSAWLAHANDNSSLAGKINLSLLLTDNPNSCPNVGEGVVTDVAEICFNILQQGSSPNITFDSLNTHINSDTPNDGTVPIIVAGFDSLFTAGAMLCDCAGAGTSCDDLNVYTVNDQFDANCNCTGEYADDDMDGIYDGIDPCIDSVYQAEDAVWGQSSGNTAGAIRNTYPQYTGPGYIDFYSGSGKFFEFTIEVDNTGSHDLGFRYALESGFNNGELKIDNIIINSALDFPVTNSWTNWDTVIVTHTFTPGSHVIRYTTNSGGVIGINIDHLMVSFCTSCTTSGQACDDGDVCTVSDVYDSNCNCEGIYMDSDNDSVCDVSDVCPGFDDLIDADTDGIPDGCDDCDNALIGTSCDDGDACTTGDIYDSNCNCAGTFSGADSDGDGVCDTEDICAGGDDNIDTDMDGIPDFCDSCNNLLVGLPCDDGDPCTILDSYQSDCSCAGIFIDSDGDGTCNILDLCEGYDDNIDTDMDGIPDGCDNCDNALIGTSCDDNNDCTINDIYDSECNCIGTFEDTDMDGICDADDQCPNYDDSIDSDLDIIPDLCDTCYDFVHQEADAYYAGALLKTYYQGYSGDGYLDYRTTNTDTIIYTVQIDTAGVYDVSIRYAANSNSRKLDVEIDGILEISDLFFPNTQAWDNWSKVLFTKNFTVGSHDIKLTTNGSNGPNIDLLSICLPGYQPEPRIAKGNNEFEQDFTNWGMQHNWSMGTTAIEIETADSAIVCGNKSAYAKKDAAYEQLYTDLDYLIMGQTMKLHFYSKGGAADVYVGKPDSVYQGTYYFKNESPIDSAFVHDSIEFVVTAPVMRVWFDLYPNDSLYLDAFSFDNTNCLINLKSTVFLEGPYDSNSGLMNDSLRSSGMIPLIEPYTGLNFQHAGRGGGEEIDNSVLTVTGNDAIVDWVMMELRDRNDSTNVLSTRSALLQSDGDVVDLDGTSPVTFSRMYANRYWISLRHRNHLGIMTGDYLWLSPEMKDLNFNTLSIYGINAQKDLGGNIKNMWSGDGNTDGMIDAIDRNAVWNNRNSLILELHDFNLDGKTDASDRMKAWNNRGKSEQLPD